MVDIIFFINYHDREPGAEYYQVLQNIYFRLKLSN